MLRLSLVAALALASSRAEDDVQVLEEGEAVSLVAATADSPLLLLGPGNFSAAQLEHENLLVELCVL